MVKYHINSKGEKAVCHATNRACRFTPVEDNSISSQQDLVAKMDAVDSKVAKTTKPVVRNHAADVKFPQKFITGIMATDAFDFDDDPYYGEYSPYSLSEEIGQVDYAAMLQGIHDEYHSGKITDDYVKYAKDHNWGNKDNFIVSRDPGYYGEVETTVELTDEFYKEVSDYYYQNSNVKDELGVLDYCRGKGFDTAGFSPLEALKTQLKTENNNKPHPRVDNATTISLKNIKLTSVHIPAKKYYDKITPEELVPATPKGVKIAGVVFEDPSGGYSLVDGYHRTKHLQNKTKLKTGNYFVLS